MTTTTTTVTPKPSGWSGKLGVDAAILVAKLSRALNRDDWQDLMCIASMAICEIECSATRAALTRKLWGGEG